MINRNELRINNLLQYKGCFYSVYSIESEVIICKNLNGFSKGNFFQENLKPIPLTEDWLLRMCFQKYQYFSDEISYKYKNYVYHSSGWFCKNVIRNIFDNFKLRNTSRS